MRETWFETLIGLIVVIIAGVFLWFALARGQDTSQSSKGAVELGVRFGSASGVNQGTDVRMAGVKIGVVRAVDLDVERAEALVTLAVDKKILPLGDGTTARIQSEGLLGGSYINLEPSPGFGEIALCTKGQVLFDKSGCGQILYAQGAVDLMTLFASFAAGSSSNKEIGASSESAPADALGSEAPK